MTHTDSAGATCACHTDVNAQRNGSEDSQDAGFDKSSAVVQENVSEERQPGEECILLGAAAIAAGAALSWLSNHYFSDTIPYGEPADSANTVQISDKNSCVVHTYLEFSDTV
ncbi:unnamed protein product [Dicrocoelium dendriticum]|nr:unnamed protein product [Dicrocoelium dendriticum]